MKKLDSIVAIVAILAMMLHICVIFLARNGFINDSYFAESNYLEVISTPFTIILIYELFLLFISISKSIPISLGKQYEIIALVLIRDVFKIISSVELKQSQISDPAILLAVFFDILFALLCFVGLMIYNKIHRSCVTLIDKRENEKSLVEVKSFASLFACFYFVLYLLGYFTNLLSSIGGEDIMTNFKNLYFVSDLFVLTVIIDVVLLLLMFKGSHKFQDIFYEGVLIISSIIVRLAFVSSTPLNGILGVSGIFIGLLISWIYSLSHKLDCK